MLYKHEQLSDQLLFVNAGFIIDEEKRKWHHVYSNKQIDIAILFIIRVFYF